MRIGVALACVASVGCGTHSLIDESSTSPVFLVIGDVKEAPDHGYVEAIVLGTGKRVYVGDDIGLTPSDVRAFYLARHKGDFDAVLVLHPSAQQRYFEFQQRMTGKRVAMWVYDNVIAISTVSKSDVKNSDVIRFYAHFGFDEATAEHIETAVNRGIRKLVIGDR